MGNLSFNIKTTKDLFQVLKEDYKEFSLNRTSSRHALHCAIIAWHLSEWLCKELKPNQSRADVTAFQEDLKQECPSLQIMNDIADGAKHFQLGRTPKIKDTEIHKGVFSQEFSRVFDITYLEIEMDNGIKVYFEDEIKNVMDFWSQYMEATIRG